MNIKRLLTSGMFFAPIGTYFLRVGSYHVRLQNRLISKSNVKRRE